MSTLTFPYSYEYIEPIVKIIGKLRYFEEIQGKVSIRLSPAYIEEERRKAKTVKVLYDFRELERRVIEWIRSKTDIVLNEHETLVLRHLCDIMFEFYSKYELDRKQLRGSNFNEFIIKFKNK
jgi:hypothetical protein